ncbi:hypothetical protein [Streptomyces griseus]|uniref:hypothetical protein n=1 Tax=Streptomyces griseus TaxID=1911 RepID=UPI003418EC64
MDEDEAAWCRHFAQLTEAATRHAAATALALSGVHSSEIGHVTGAVLDLKQQRVFAPGTSRVLPRWCCLDAWAATALRHRLERLPDGREALVGSGEGTDAQRQARIGVTLRDVLTRAGLSDDPALRPSSLTAHAGWRLLRKGGRIETAAQVLGMRSLDRTAELVGYDWRPPSADAA